MRTVAALYIDPLGHYPSMPYVECWDEARDARGYDGPHPVVAHPPCQLWGSFAAVNYKRWGGEHNRPGNDQGRFEHALTMVRCYWGVLEHPAKTNAWARFGLPKPAGVGWERAPGTHQCGYHDQRGKERNKPTVGKREASATPPDFAEALVALARNSGA